jgi:succinate dehydrogenase / fumarate reductase cytochrome b subunit
MAATGILLFLFVLGHLAGNLQVFLPPDSTGLYAINKYAQFLHHNRTLLWTARLVLLAAVTVHVVAGFQLYLGKQRARPVEYHELASVNSTASSRYMFWTGVLVFGFVLYHLMHLTFGWIHPSFDPENVQHNLEVGLRGLSGLVYLISMVGLGLHLRHGLYSVFQSLGAGNPSVSQTALKVAAVVATLLVLAEVSMPLAMMAGFRG